MSEFSAEDIQRAADEVRRGGFGDFMFRDPGIQQTTTSSSSRMTTRRITSRRLTSSSSRVTSHNNHVHHPKRCEGQTGWRNTPHGNTQTKICWDNGNMWEFCIRRRK